MGSSQSLQLHVPAVAEAELAAALDQGLEQPRHQDLPSHRLRGDAGGEDDALAEEVLALLDGLAGVESDADLDRLIRVLSVVIEA